MPAISQQKITDAARQAFQSTVLPPGTDRAWYTGYVATVCNAVAQALDVWRKTVYLEGVTITAGLATGGRLRASVSIEQQILQRAPSGWEVYNKAIAAGLHNQFQSFADKVSVPGLPWYPSFVAYPGPAAPPTENQPCPLLAIAWSARKQLEAGPISDMIVNKLPNPKPACGKDIAKAIGSGIEMAVAVWLTEQQVRFALGRGPVPTYRYPFVPAGPVMMGSIIPTPGHLSY